MRTPGDPDRHGHAPDRDGVRVVRKPRRVRDAVGVMAGVAAIGLIAALAWSQRDASAARVQAAGPARDVAHTAGSSSANTAAPKSSTVDTDAPARAPAERLPMPDSNDLASHFKPGDPEPTGAELITALHEAGVRTGIGAFNPPGTSPPLQGLAVPADFPLPDGYVRHHQVTDEGVPLEPILMFAPDFALLDSRGRTVPIPANRVVPPELAPPGLPLRRIRIPTR